MEEIYRGNHYVLYSHVALYDAEDKDSYPVFETGGEPAIFCNKGVGVSTVNDTNIEIIIYRYKKKVDDIFYGSGEVEVGNQDLIVGNKTTGYTAKVSCLPSQVSVSVYVNTIPEEVISDTFIID